MTGFHVFVLIVCAANLVLCLIVMSNRTPPPR